MAEEQETRKLRPDSKATNDLGCESMCGGADDRGMDMFG